jgi:hypothetical protein
MSDAGRTETDRSQVASRARIVTMRVFASAVSAVGVVLLGRLLLELAEGTLAHELFPDSDGGWAANLAALVLRFPAPYHVFSVGLILQRRWLSPTWARVAWVCVVSSGLWLGGSLVVRAIVLR